MKKLMNVIAAISVLFIACTEEKGLNEVYILVDNTEIRSSNESLVSTDNLIDLLGQNGQVTWQIINSVSLNEKKSLSFEMPEDATRLQEKKIIKPFKEKFEGIKKKYLGAVSESAGGSTIYKPLNSILKKWSGSKSKKTLIICSDMIENSKFGNFYKSAPVENVVMQIENTGGELPDDITNLKIIILYNPEGNTEKQNKFDQAMIYWEKLFSDAGIDYEVKANL